ncbi:hypothetical protein NBRC111894_1020 [Sporolactobacillus inulinus]|uniref:Uncharacterized protein n=1 Tax=Sporolactobacillus inulinus TaxID=2078 RepID=A0A4Y1Z8Y8_9BACL|nr:hypothetical protein NBRC111894_1020 [Sporolactobacillus inulinus]
MPKIPIGHWADLLIQFITNHFEGFFGYIASGIQSFVDSLVWLFAFMTPIVFILLLRGHRLLAPRYRSRFIYLDRFGLNL